LKLAAKQDENSNLNSGKSGSLLLNGGHLFKR
jgi:hypothetical protein